MRNPLPSLRPLVSRRQTLAGLAALSLASRLPRPARAQNRADAPPLGPAEPYDFPGLVERARGMASRPYAAPAAPNAEALQRIDYDAFQKIRFRAAAALFAERQDAWPLAPFHLHALATEPVGLHVVTEEGARRVRYSAAAFDYAGDLSADDFPGDLGYAGFRLLERERPGDWLAFMGASYFRSADPLHQYGLSARGIAVDTGVPGKTEEFPRFEAFWIDQRGEGLTIDALLDGPSLAGAFRFRVARADEATTMDVAARLFMRDGVERLGVAPLTSMYWYSETNRHAATDWRPEVHDSDGLALWTGAGERLWRPLGNPPRVVTSSFVDRDPRGFGLLQRDREFANYQDDGVFYEKRPSAWVAPQGDWGPGAVTLLEIPTDDEIYDNVVAFWSPERIPAAGDALSYDYRLSWTAERVVPNALGRTVATRLGRAGVPGQPRPPRGNKVAIDFDGGRLAEFETTDAVTPEVTTSAGRIENPYAIRVVDTDRWRLVFDVYPPEGADEAEPLELRAFLAHGGEPLTETWAMQHWPVDFAG